MLYANFEFVLYLKGFNGIDLLALKAPPKEPTRYATKLAGLLFSKEELLQGMVAPGNEKYARTALDTERITIMISKYQ